MNPRQLLLSNLSWCPGVESIADFVPDRDVSGARMMMGGAAIAAIALAMIFAYRVYLAPASTIPLMVSVDGVEYPDSYFNMSYDYASLRGKQVLFDLGLNSGEFAPSSSGGQPQKTVYEFAEWDEAWPVPEDMETPNVVLCFARWLANGTHVEVDERWYGPDYGQEINSDDAIVYNMGRGKSNVNVYFEVQRSSIVYDILSELGGDEIVSIEKVYTKAGSAGPVWIYAVQLSGPPYKAVLVRFP